MLSVISEVENGQRKSAVATVYQTRSLHANVRRSSRGVVGWTISFVPQGCGDSPAYYTSLAGLLAIPDSHLLRRTVHVRVSRSCGSAIRFCSHDELLDARDKGRGL